MKVLFVSLGCDKNLVDSEMMITALRKDGFEIIDQEEEAEIIVVNTCCFIGDAKEESINTLLEMAQYKECGKCRLLVAAGCLAQRYHREIRTEIPEVDVIVGTTGYGKLGDVLRQAWEGKSDPERRIESLEDINHIPEPLTDRQSSSGGYYAYLKIAEGCDKCCTYCVIPKVRGHYQSIPMDNLVEQAKHLAAQGAVELILVAQETTLYGVDLYGKKSLPQLLGRLSEVDGIRWIRLLYCYPEEVTSELVQAIRNLPKVCHYLDIPIQHASDEVLRRMGRKTGRAGLEETIAMLRREIPDIALRTTLITGFPGETEEDFTELKEFVRQMRFDRLGVFAYSQEEDTPAAQMEGQIPEEIKEARRDEIMALQQEIAFERNEEWIGQTMSVMVEGLLPEEDVVLARTYRDAPEVDGFVFVENAGSPMSGEFLQVKITAAKGYDLVAECLES